MPYVSPYARLPQSKWKKKTEDLLKTFSLTAEEIVKPVLEAWDSIFESKIGRHGIQIGKQIFPIPQIMASYLHELIPLEFAATYPGNWRADKVATEKDLVYIPDDHFSVEIKTSSHATNIYANRSYAQPSESLKKNKNGYYLAVNFEKFGTDTGVPQRPLIRRIRMGWLDYTDWRGQAQPTGQQASLFPASRDNKLITLFEAIDSK